MANKTVTTVSKKWYWNWNYLFHYIFGLETSEDYAGRIMVLA